MKREAVTSTELAVQRYNLECLIWDCLPWYKRLWRVLTGKVPRL